jgi:uncharacterized YigZ family protein
MGDTYQTITGPSEGLFKDKGSKFISYLFPVTNEDEIRDILASIKKEHYSARHHCYAWRLGMEDIRFRANDDGEPSSTAGKPILGQLVSHDLTNVLCVVVRYFGGTLLGVSGLIQAYRQAALTAIESASIETRIIEFPYEVKCSYQELNTVMQVIKSENLSTTHIDMQEQIRIDISVRKSETERIEDIFSQIYGVSFRHI